MMIDYYCCVDSVVVKRSPFVFLRRVFVGIVALLLVFMVFHAEGSDDTSAKKAGKDARIDALIRELDSKQIALENALKETARLRELVERILKANRREQFVMYYNMGCIYKANAEYSKAEQQFLKALAKDPSDPDIYYNLGILYDDDLKRPKKARKYYEEFLSVAPRGKDAAQVREWILSLTN